VAGDLAAVDVQDLTGDIGRGLQEKDAVDDVADLADPAERREPVAEVLVVFRRVRGGLDDARGDGVDPDAEGGDLDGQ
jgi:hypothetical protein